jgi:ATP diphosphatase
LVAAPALVARLGARSTPAALPPRAHDHSSAIDGVPRALPGLTRAHRIGEKASSVGFDWSAAGDARLKIDEELAEADAAAAAGDADALTEEIGDLLFAVTSWARLSGVHAEGALERALAKFSARFRALETALHGQGRELAVCSPDELEAAWQEAKIRVKSC